MKSLCTFLMALFLGALAHSQTTLPSTTYTGPGGTTGTIRGTTTPPIKGVQGSASPSITMQSNTYVVPNAASVMIPSLGQTEILVRPVGDFGNYLNPGSPTDFSPGDQNVGKAGSFRLDCLFSHMLAVDPIVFQNQDGISHWHQFFDNSSVNAYSDASDLLNSGGTGSCAGGVANISGYWTPVVVDMTTHFIVKPKSNEVYYKEAFFYGQNCGDGGGVCGTPPSARALVRELPVGLRMIGGNPGNTTGNSQDGAFSSSDPNYLYPKYVCTQPDGTQQPFLSHFPGVECPNGSEITVLIYMPNCWDGVNLDSPDHRSHMAFSNETGGGCPSGHPVPVAWVSYNLHYQVTAQSRPENWRFSSDNYPLNLPGGGSVHGDWAFGWRPEFMTMMVNNCIRRNVDCHTNLLGNHATLTHNALDGVGNFNPLFIYRYEGKQGETITRRAPANVRFGNPQQWVYKAISSFRTPYVCDVSFFGSDPTPGVAKYCQTDDPIANLDNVRVMVVGDGIAGAFAPSLFAQIRSEGFAKTELIGNARAASRSGSAVVFDVNTFAGYKAQYWNIASGSGTQNTWPGLYGDFRDIRTMMDGQYPDILLLHIGSGDYCCGASGDTTSELAAYKKLIDQARIQNIGVRIFVAKIAPNTTGEPWVSNLNAALPAWVAANTNPTSPITLVDQNTGFNTGTMTTDGTIPNTAGQTFMNTRWMNAIRLYLK